MRLCGPAAFPRVSDVYVTDQVAHLSIVCGNSGPFDALNAIAVCALYGPCSGLRWPGRTATDRLSALDKTTGRRATTTIAHGSSQRNRRATTSDSNTSTVNEHETASATGIIARTLSLAQRLRHQERRSSGTKRTATSTASMQQEHQHRRRLARVRLVDAMDRDATIRLPEQLQPRQSQPSPRPSRPR